MIRANKIRFQPGELVELTASRERRLAFVVDSYWDFEFNAERVVVLLDGEVAPYWSDINSVKRA